MDANHFYVIHVIRKSVFNNVELGVLPKIQKFLSALSAAAITIVVFKCACSGAESPVAAQVYRGKGADALVEARSLT